MTVRLILFSSSAISLTILLVPFMSEAQGLVTCTGLDCNFCKFVDMFDLVKKWLVTILIVISVIMLAITGIQMAYIAAGNGDALGVLKERLTNIVIGFILIIAASVLVDTLLKALVTDEKILSWSTVTTSAPELCFNQLPPTKTPSSIDAFEGDLQTSAAPIALTGPIPGAVDTGQKICFPGNGTSGQVCLDKIEVPNSGAYKYADGAPAGYQRPGYFIDLSKVDPNTPLTANFTVGEIAQARKGQYAYIDPNLPSNLEAVRTDLGSSVQINSGYRSPGYNSSLEGAAVHSRHQYGDAVDIAITSSNSASEIVASCKRRGATFTKTYSGHVHCDWR